MATYEELYDLRNHDVVLHKIVVAVAVAADKIRVEAPGTANHANRVVWAAEAFTAPQRIGQQVMWAVLAANNALTVAQIEGASDAAIQTAVDAVVDVLAGS
jgi:hypothetical protein